jgi:rhamnose transport system ATP-binding protein
MAPVIELRGIGKRFGTVEVLCDVDFELRSGKVHALAGENGAGKSTLVKILGGVHQPDGGRILMDGEPIRILDPADGRRQGIAVVHQHPALFPDLSVAENIFVGRQPRRHGLVDWRRMHQRAEALLEDLRVDIDVGAPIKSLTIAERQTVEIAKALSIDARVLIMDEPTSAIAGPEVERLFQIVAHLQSRGVAILFISHFIDEILAYSDDITIMRSGRRVVTAPASSLEAEDVIRHMIGTEPAAFFPKEAVAIGPPVLGIEGLSGAGFVEAVSVDLRGGEIIGLFGLVGAGRSEVAQMIFGITKAERGVILVDGKPVGELTPRKAMRRGISLVPEDRHEQGLVLPFTIRENETLPVLRRLSGALGIVDRDREAKVAKGASERMRVVATGVEQVTGTLSGGNQQKVLLAKWLIPTPKILILDEPTRGIDIGAKAEIHRIVSQLAGEGMAIILISDDAQELIGMADRILVFRNGRIEAEVSRPEFDRAALLLAAVQEAEPPEGSVRSQ